MLRATRAWGPFLERPETFRAHFGRHNSPCILKRRRLEARNFAVFLDFIPFTTYERTSFTEYVGRSFTNGFSDPKSFREFRETAPWLLREL